MKSKLTASVGLSLLLAASSSWAGTKIPVEELPPVVVDRIDEYFPGAELQRVEREREDGRTQFEVTVNYKDLVLELEVEEDGRLEDVDLKG